MGPKTVILGVTAAIFSPLAALAQVPAPPLSLNSLPPDIVAPFAPTSSLPTGLSQPYTGSVSSQPQSCPLITKNLSVGSRGADVTALQQYLISQNLLAPDSATGYFGRLTEAAAQQWQSSHGLVSSGSAATTGYGAVGPKTRAAIASACSGVSTSPSTASIGSLQATTPSIQSTINTLLAQVKALQEQISRLKSGNTPSNNSQTSPGASSDTAGSTTFYTYNSHTSPVSCSWSGGTVANGSTVTAYQSPSVAAGSQCVSQQRTCTNGSLSGSYANPSCSVTTTASTTTSTGAASCSFNGQTVAHGSSVTAYQTSSVAFGSKCHLETRTCRNGTLTGSYGNRSCSVSGPLNAFRILVGLTQINSDEAAQAASFAADGAGIDVSVSTAINWTQTFSDMNAGSWATSGDAATCAQCAPGSWDDIANVTAASKALGRLVDGAVFYNEDFDNVATIPPLSDAQCPLVSNPNGDRMLDDRISKVKSLIAQREAIDAELASLLGVQPKKPRGRPPKIEAPTHQELEPGT